MIFFSGIVQFYVVSDGFAVFLVFWDKFCFDPIIQNIYYNYKAAITRTGVIIIVM